MNSLWDVVFLDSLPGDLCACPRDLSGVPGTKSLLCSIGNTEYPYSSAIMDIGIVTSHTYVHDEGNNCDRLPPVKTFLTDYHAHLTDHAAFFLQYLGFALI